MAQLQFEWFTFQQHEEQQRHTTQASNVREGGKSTYEGTTEHVQRTTASGLVVIADDASGQFVTCTTSHRSFTESIHTARCILKLKLDTVCVKAHYGEGSTADYYGNRLMW